MSIEKYGRHWAVVDTDGALICVCVYRKGALEVVRRLQDTHVVRDTAPQSRLCPQPPAPGAPRGRRHP
jgi:hypothetical protein